MSSMDERAHLVLADGTIFPDEPFGARGTTTGEAVFTTTMTGYQEVLTDPSYTGQIVTMTAPEIGNTGVNAADAESVDGKPHVAGFVLRDASPMASNWRSEQTLDAYLAKASEPWKTPAGTDILWRSRAKKTPELLVKIIKDPATKEDDQPRYFRALDFLAGPEKEAALKSLLE